MCVNMLCSGDQVARKGTLTGGYYDPSRSRLRIQHEIYKLRRSLETTEAEKAEIREQVEHILTYNYASYIESISMVPLYTH